MFFFPLHFLCCICCSSVFSLSVGVLLLWRLQGCPWLSCSTLARLAAGTVHSALTFSSRLGFGSRPTSSNSSVLSHNCSIFYYLKYCHTGVCRSITLVHGSIVCKARPSMPCSIFHSNVLRAVSCITGRGINTPLSFGEVLFLIH